MESLTIKMGIKDNKPRKTINVQTIKEHVNEQLNNPDISQGEKKGLCGLLTNILLATNNYEGYNNSYWIEKGIAEWDKDGNPKGTNKVAPKKYFGEEYTRHYY